MWVSLSCVACHKQRPKAAPALPCRSGMRGRAAVAGRITLDAWAKSVSDAMW